MIKHSCQCKFELGWCIDLSVGLEIDSIFIGEMVWKLQQYGVCMSEIEREKLEGGNVWSSNGIIVDARGKYKFKKIDSS